MDYGPLFARSDTLSNKTSPIPLSTEARVNHDTHAKKVPMSVRCLSLTAMFISPRWVAVNDEQRFTELFRWLLRPVL
jgi:hypothetical protein